MLKVAALIVCAGVTWPSDAQQTSSVVPSSAEASAVVTAPTDALTASAFLSKALLAFSPGGTAPKITLTGSVDRTIGSFRESGTLTLTSDSLGRETEDWSLSSGEQLFAKTAVTGTRTCSAQIGGKDITTQVDQGCSRIVPWFAPWSVLPEANAQNASASIVTTDSDSSQGLVRLRFVPSYGDLSSLPTKRLQTVAKVMQESAVDVLFDATTALAKRVEYRLQTNGDPASAIQMASAFSDYRLDGGFMLPHHLQRYMQRTLEADINVTTITTK